VGRRVKVRGFGLRYAVGNGESRSPAVSRDWVSADEKGRCFLVGMWRQCHAIMRQAPSKFVAWYQEARDHHSSDSTLVVANVAGPHLRE